MKTPATLWQQHLAEAFSSVEALCDHLQLDISNLPLLNNAKDFPLRVPRDFVDCMVKGDAFDPLLRQILPLQNELQTYPSFTNDPVGDLAALAETGVIHKYHGRLLLIVTGACAVHCRYCFRRNFPYNEVQLTTQKINQAIDYIKSRPEVTEVILSGGDPLLLSDDKLTLLLQQISNLEQIKRIRIHSRLPIVLPARITTELLTTLSGLRQKLVLVVHCNHANELSLRVANALSELKQTGLTLLNQSVLLKAVNDNSESLRQLSEKLFSLGVLPYYLHQLDKANGTGHFEVDEAVAKQIYSSLQAQLPGYLLPKWVKEQAGAAYKLPIS